MIGDENRTDEAQLLTRRGFAQLATGALVATGLGAMISAGVAAHEAESGDDHGSGGGGQDDPPGDFHGGQNGGQANRGGDDHGRHGRGRGRGRR